MKRKILIAVLAALCLVGCARAEDPYRVDTVVYIPADPTPVPMEAAAPEETEAPTEEPVPAAAETEPVPEETEPAATEPEATEAAKKPASSGKKPSSSKKPSSNKSDTDKEEKATEPPAAKPEETEPPETKPAATEPAPTQPAQTEPAETGVAATEPVATQPVATQPDTPEKPATEPSVPEEPATEPPVTEPEPTDPPLYDISGYSVGSLEYAMRDAINAYRAESGLGELKLSSRLCAIASCRGYEISQVWSHTRPDGRSYKTVLSDYGYGGSAQELLVYVSGSGDGQSIVDKWMSSDSHKDLLLGSYSTVGIGVYRVNGLTYIAC